MEPAAPAAPSLAVPDSPRTRQQLRRPLREPSNATTPVMVTRTIRRRPGWVTASLWILVLVYGVALAFIALWPTYVDVPARPMLDSITAEWPLLTFARIEFIANVLLFVPFGFLFTLILRRGHYVVLPAALVVSVAVEACQVLIDERVSSLLDVVANVTGACVGIVFAALIRAVRR